MTNRSRSITRHPHPFVEDTALLHIELRLAEILAYQASERALRDADRLGFSHARSIRSRLGESLIRLGRRVSGERLANPAWTG
jgi:hypothetical protein